MAEITALLENAVVLRLGVTLLHFLWQGTIIAVLAALALVLLRRSSPAVRYSVLLMLFMGMALCPVATFVVSVNGTAADVGAIESASEPIPAASVDDSRVAAPPGSMAPSAADGGGSTGPYRKTAVVWQRVERHLGWVAVVWALGVLILSLRLLLAWGGLGVSRRSGTDLNGEKWRNLVLGLSERLRVSRPVRLIQSTRVSVPMVVGWLRPVVLLPAEAVSGLTPEQIEAIVAHELAHIRRADYVVNLVQTATEILLFYHPAVWWLSRSIREEREHCCDDLAAAAVGNTLTYARALATVQRLHGVAGQPGLAATGGALYGRIRRLAAGRGPTSGQQRPPWAAAAVVLLVLAAMAVGAVVVGRALRTGADSTGPEGTVTLELVLTLQREVGFDFYASGPALRNGRANENETYQEVARRLTAEAVRDEPLDISVSRGWWITVHMPFRGDAEITIQGERLREALDPLFDDLRLMSTEALPITADVLDESRQIIENRAALYGLRGTVVEAEPPAGLRVQASVGDSESGWAERFLSQRGLLEFRSVPREYASGDDHHPEISIVAGREVFTFHTKAGDVVPTQQVIRESRVVATGHDLESSSAKLIHARSDHPQVTFALNREAGLKFKEFTGRHAGTYMAMVLDGDVLACPMIISAVSGSGAIMSAFDQPGGEERARRLAAVLNAGPLPLPRGSLWMSSSSQAPSR